MEVVGKKKAVLIVEDEELLGDILQEELEGKSLTILRASGGKMALEVVKSKPIDLVVTDVRMAEGDGRFVLTEIAKLPGKKPAIIVVTGLSDLSEEEASQLGAKAFIHKPFDIETVVNTVLSCLE